MSQKLNPKKLKQVQSTPAFRQRILDAENSVLIVDFANFINSFYYEIDDKYIVSIDGMSIKNLETNEIIRHTPTKGVQYKFFDIRYEEAIVNDFRSWFIYHYEHYFKQFKEVCFITNFKWRDAVIIPDDDESPIKIHMTPAEYYENLAIINPKLSDVIHKSPKSKNGVPYDLFIIDDELTASEAKRKPFESEHDYHVRLLAHTHSKLVNIGYDDSTCTLLSNFKGISEVTRSFIADALFSMLKQYQLFKKFNNQDGTHCNFRDSTGMIIRRKYSHFLNLCELNHCFVYKLFEICETYINKPLGRQALKVFYSGIVNDDYAVRLMAKSYPPTMRKYVHSHDTNMFISLCDVPNTYIITAKEFKCAFDPQQVLREFNYHKMSYRELRFEYALRGCDTTNRFFEGAGVIKFVHNTRNFPKYVAGLFDKNALKDKQYKIYLPKDPPPYALAVNPNTTIEVVHAYRKLLQEGIYLASREYDCKLTQVDISNVEWFKTCHEICESNKSFNLIRVSNFNEGNFDEDDTEHEFDALNIVKLAGKYEIIYQKAPIM